MKYLGARRWLLATFALGLAAIALQMVALHWTAKGVGGSARAVQARAAGASANDLESMRQTSRAALGLGGELSMLGLGVAVVSGLCLLLSTVKRELGWRLLAGGVLVAYVLLSLVML